MPDSANFLLKVIALSAALSLLIKYVGPLLPFQRPYSPEIELAIAIVLLPSIVIGLGLLALTKRTQ